MKRHCIHCGEPCRFLLCDACHEHATSNGFYDDAAPTLRIEQFIPEVGLPVSVDGISRFG